MAEIIDLRPAVAALDNGIFNAVCEIEGDLRAIDEFADARSRQRDYGREPTRQRNQSTRPGNQAPRPKARDTPRRPFAARPSEQRRVAAPTSR